MEDLKDLASRSLRWISGKAPAGLEAELFLARSEERSLERREGKLEGISQSQAEGVGLRVLSGGRMGFASAAGLNLEAVQGLYAQAVAQLDFLEPDPHKGFPAPTGHGPDAALEASLQDDSLFTQSWDKVLPRLAEMEDLARSLDGRITGILRAGYGESRGEVVIANTRGILTSERGGSVSVGLSALCGQEGELQVGSAYQSARRRDSLDFKKVAREASERTTALLGARKLPSRKRSVIFDPWVAGEFLDLVSSLLCADQVQRGKSLLAGKLGTRVGSPLATFHDDPRRLGGIGSSLYDDEGCPTSAKTMVEGGVVKEYFFDTYTANREGRATNACAGRGSYRALPGPGSSNFYLAPGTISREKLIADTQDGILVFDVMGMHMADTISGEFSVGISGIAVVDGKLSHPVKAGMLSGNFIDLLSRLDAVADDLTFYGGLGAPTFRVADMAVA